MITWKDWARLAVAGAAIILLGLFYIGIARGAELPSILKQQKFTIVEKSPAGVVALSEPHQETKDIRSVYVLIYYAEASDSGTQAVLGKVELNCALGQIAYDTAYRLAADGTVLGTLDPKHPGWREVPGDQPSPAGDLFARVCGHEAQPTRETKISYSYSDAPPVNSHSPSESWDQANLKKNDSGCPTAIYHVNPQTKLLEQCP